MVAEDIKGDIEFTSETSRCTVDMKSCGKHLFYRFVNVCDALNVKNAFYSNLLGSFEPVIKCPIKAGNYSLSKTPFDLKYFQVFPIEGYVYSVIFKWLQKSQLNKSEKIIMCLHLDVKVEAVNKKV